MPAHDMATKNTQIDFTTNIDGKHTVYSEWVPFYHADLYVTLIIFQEPKYNR